jgi:hypothetical protein
MTVGAQVGIRTRDLILTKNVLCLLSYLGVAALKCSRSEGATLDRREVEHVDRFDPAAEGDRGGVGDFQVQLFA